MPMRPDDVQRAKTGSRIDRMSKRLISELHVRRMPGRSLGRLFFGGQSIPCMLGGGGLTRRKREGDGATPCGRFKILEVLLRLDRWPRQGSRIPNKIIRKASAWCDDRRSYLYNRPCSTSDAVRHEELWRSDRVYDVVLVLDYNINPRRLGAGSAIFFHLTTKERSPTAGCVAIAPDAMRRLLTRLSATTHITIR